MSYEKNIKELEDVVKKLSGERVGMEDSLTLYARGIELAKQSLTALEAFRGKIELLNKDLSALEVEIEPD